jgi:type IV pilus assembly protein PilM
MKFEISGFFEDIANFFKGGSVLGVDVGTASVKVVELAKKRSSFSVVNYGILETGDYLKNASRAIQSSGLRVQKEVVAELLDLLLSEMGTRCERACIAIPSFSSFVTTLEMPVLDKQEMENAVQFQARQFVPIPPDQVSIDWVEVARYEDENGQPHSRVLLIGIPKDVINVYTEACDLIGISAVRFELDSVSLSRSIVSSSEEPFLVLDIGALSTNIIVVQGGFVHYSNQIEYGGAYLTNALSHGLDLSKERAEELKRHSGISDQGAGSQLSTLLPSHLDVIIDEVNNVRGAYGERYSKKVDSIVMVGGGSNVSGIGEYLGGQLGLEVFDKSTFSNLLYDSRIEPTVLPVGRVCATALGVAQGYFN